MLAPNWVTDFNENSENPTKLIMAKAVADGSDGATYNVVASTSSMETQVFSGPLLTIIISYRY